MDAPVYIIENENGGWLCLASGALKVFISPPQELLGQMQKLGFKTRIKEITLKSLPELSSYQPLNTEYQWGLL